MADCIWKQDDTLPALTATLKYSDGSLVDLTGVTSVKFVMRGENASTVTTNADATVVGTPTTGQVSYTPTAADTASVGRYLGQFVVTFSAGVILTFPTDGYLSIDVEPSLTGTNYLGQVYAHDAAFRDYLGISEGVGSDLLLQNALKSASRAIDNYCQRKFWLDPAPVARTFVPDTLLYVNLESDIGSQTGLAVATDPSGDGTFDVTWAASDFQLLPQNAPFEFPEARPWTAMRAIGTKTFPWLVNTWLTRLDRVQVTAKWGWPAVPADVTQACLIKAARLYHRKDSPQGVAGFGDFGPVRVGRLEDPDVCLLLDPYRYSPVFVA